MAPPASTRVLIVSHDVVGQRMAGVGVRYSEMARVLSSHCQVTLAAPEGDGLESSSFRLVGYHPSARGAGPADEAWVRQQVAQADVVITNGRLLTEHRWLRQENCRLVVDLYGPSLLENFELFKGEGSERQWQVLGEGLSVLSDQLASGDFFLCSSQRQRDFLLGLLLMSGRVNPTTCAEDPELRHLIALAPFGVPARPPSSRQSVLKGVWPGIDPRDKVILWGGGIWEWLDPLTLLRAMDRLRRHRPDAKLFFMGKGHPDPTVMPATRRSAESEALAAELGLLNRWVFFNRWVPYAEREAYLVEADLGVSLHRPTLESRFSYRTRVLDYVWAGLPLVLTEGDEWAELARVHGLGLVVPPGDDEAVCSALLALLEDGPESEERRGRVRALAEQMTWEKTLAPLVSFCLKPGPAADKAERHSLCYQPALCLNCQSLKRREDEIVGLREEIERWRNGRVMRALLGAQGLRNRLGRRAQGRP